MLSNVGAGTIADIMRLCVMGHSSRLDEHGLCAWQAGQEGAGKAAQDVQRDQHAGPGGGGGAAGPPVCSQHGLPFIHEHQSCLTPQVPFCTLMQRDCMPPLSIISQFKVADVCIAGIQLKGVLSQQHFALPPDSPAEVRHAVQHL